MPISAIVLTLNEGHSIARCLESLHFCDEILVIDSGSQDDTVKIAQKYTSQIHQVTWKGFVDTRNEALKLAKGDWILSIDADEVVPPELATEILQTVRSTSKSAFTLPRKTIHFDRWIRYGGWYPNRLVRLFKRNEGAWVGCGVHERWKSTGEVGELSQDLIHYSFESISDQVYRNDRYSTLSTVALSQEGVHFSLIKLLTKPWVKFLETYFLKRGFKDGYPGFIISVSAAYSVFLKWAKLWEMEQSK